MNHSLVKHVDEFGIAVCVLYIFGHVLLSQSTVLISCDTLLLAQPVIVITGLTISSCIVVIISKLNRMNLLIACAIAVLIAVLAVSAIQTEDTRLLESVLLIITVMSIDKQKLVKWVAVALAAGISVVGLASLCGLIWNKDVLPNDYLVFGYGFSHPNTLGALLTCLAAAVLYVGWSYRAWVLSVIMSIFLALFSKIMLSSNTAAVLILAYCVASVVGHLFNKKLALFLTKRARVLSACILALIVVIGMLYLMAAYDNTNPVHKALNSLLHYRPYFGAEYYNANGGFTILGRPYMSVSTYHQGMTFESLDSGVMYMGGVYGLLPLLCCFALFTYLIAYLIAYLPESEKSCFVWVMVVIGVFNLLTEGYPLFVYTNVSLLLLSDGLVWRGESVQIGWWVNGIRKQRT